MTWDAYKPVSPVQCPWCGCKEFETDTMYASDGLERYTCKDCELTWSDYDTWDIVNRWRSLMKKLRECNPEFDEVGYCKLCGLHKEEHLGTKREIEVRPLESKVGEE